MGIKSGTMLSEIGFTNFPIVAKNNELDFIIVDCEHGAFDQTVLATLIVKAKLVGMKVIVRLGDNRREMITKLADMGATGFLLPMTNDAEDIQKVVQYAKYSPVGKRGISTTRAHTLYNPPKLQDYMKMANDEMEIYAQIETAKGVENITDILGIEGVSGVFMGPNDLSDDLNCIGNQGPIIECIKKISDESKHANKKWGIITTNQELLDAAFACDVDMISYGSELNMLIDGCKKVKQKTKKEKN